MVMANQIVQEGDNSPADVFLTENSPAMVMVEKAGLFAPVDARDARAGARGVPARERHVDRHRRAHHGLRLQHGDADARPSCPARCSTSPRPSGRAAGARRRRVPTSRRSSRRCSQLRGPEETGDWLAGLKRNALAYRGNFEAMRGANVGEVEGALIYHYYYFGDRAGTGESSDKVGAALFRQRGSGRFRLDLGRRRAGLEQPSRGGAGIPRLRHRARGPGDPARRQPLRIRRSAAASRPNAALPPLDKLGYPKVDPSLLNAQEVVALMTAAGVM